MVKAGLIDDFEKKLNALKFPETEYKYLSRWMKEKKM